MLKTSEVLEWMEQNEQISHHVLRNKFEWVLRKISNVAVWMSHDHIMQYFSTNHWEVLHFLWRCTMHELISSQSEMFPPLQTSKLRTSSIIYHLLKCSPMRKTFCLLQLYFVAKDWFVLLTVSFQNAMKEGCTSQEDWRQCSGSEGGPDRGRCLLGGRTQPLQCVWGLLPRCAGDRGSQGNLPQTPQDEKGGKTGQKTVCCMEAERNLAFTAIWQEIDP